MKTAVIGDVHGCLEEFVALYNIVTRDHGCDRVIQLGDLMDRGPHQALCVKFAMEMGIDVVASNHDDKHVRYRGHANVEAYGGKKNPMTLYANAVEQHGLLSTDEIDWLYSCPDYIEFDDNWVAVHAGFEPGLPLAEQNPRKVIRVRYVDPVTGLMASLEEGNAGAPAGAVPWWTKWTGKKNVIFGHQVLGQSVRTLFPDAWVLDEKTGYCLSVDTGCVYGGALSAVIFGGVHLDFVSVDARRVYYDKSIPEALR